MSLSEELTLYCLSYQRPAMLERTLKFYSEYECKVIVADGSDQPLCSNIIKSPNIDYYHMPQCSGGERAKFAMSKVATPYVAWVPDDDFMLPSANNSCVDYLNNMPEYVACSGRAMFYEEHPEGVIYREAFPGYRDKDFYQSSANIRLKSCFQNYDVFHLWAVVRTAAWVKALTFSKLALDLQLEEAVYEFAIAAQGKSKVLNCLRWLRSRCPQVDWRHGVPDANSYFLLKNEERQVALEKLTSLLFETLPDELEGINKSDVAEIFSLLDDDAGRRRWFAPEASGKSVSIPLDLKVKQFAKRILAYLSCPNNVKRNNNHAFAQMREQLVKINNAELDHAHQLLIKYPVLCEVQ